MDLKQKYAAVKEKCKEHAPTIIAAAATVTAVVLAVANQRLKNEFETELAQRCDRSAAESHIHMTCDANQAMMDGETRYLINPDYDFRLALHKEIPTED